MFNFFWYAGFFYLIFWYWGFEGLEMLWGMEDLRWFSFWYAGYEFQKVGGKSGMRDADLPRVGQKVAIIALSHNRRLWLSGIIANFKLKIT